MSTRLLTVAAGVVWTLATPPAAVAQTDSPLQTGIALYAAASYDEALMALDAARALDLSEDHRVALDQHRMLCLLALGRTTAADEAAASLLQTRPAFTMSVNDASPRVRAMFDQTRRRVLPAVARRVYGEAKQAYEGGDYAAARHGFAQVAQMLADPQLTSADPALDDLRTLADGFRQLSAAAVDRRSTRRDLETVPAPLGSSRPLAADLPVAAAVIADAPELDAIPAGEASRAAVTAATSGPTPAVMPAMTPTAAAPFAPLGIFTYDWRDKDVAPPVAVTQALSGWWGAMGEPPAGTPLGVLDVLVDESGRVTEARIYQSVNRVFDAVLLQSAKEWRYRPAMKDGRPVKYRRVTGVMSGR